MGRSGGTSAGYVCSTRVTMSCLPGVDQTAVGRGPTGQRAR
jgi:hypothetical protein